MPKFAANMANWNNLTRMEQLDEIYNASFHNPQLIFKHSTRCSISSMALDRMERQWNIMPEEISPAYLDLIAFRNISNAVSEKYQVVHESPQILLIKDGKCIYTTSHNDIRIEALNAQLSVA